MVHEQHQAIFKAGSRTYYHSSRFFPKEIRDEVFILYGFVRVADNFVDALPQNPEGFYEFCRLYRRAAAGHPADDPIIDSFAALQQRKQFDPQWTEAFLLSMEMDLHTSQYETLDETLKYIYGSAETIGLYMAAVMELPQQARQYAALLGRAMQYINFIRDIDEDNRLRRRYLPLEGTELPDLDERTARRYPEEFCRYIRREIRRYYQWQQQAEIGYSFIPKSCRIPIQTASDMYKWTADTIYRQPLTVFSKKIKPSKPRVISRFLSNFLRG